MLGRLGIGGFYNNGGNSGGTVFGANTVFGGPVLGIFTLCDICRHVYLSFISTSCSLISVTILFELMLSLSLSNSLDKELFFSSNFAFCDSKSLICDSLS